MRHFYRTHLAPAAVLAKADEFFPTIGLTQSTTAPRTRTYAGTLGGLRLAAKPEGGHYTFVHVDTDQMGESRLDRNVKKLFTRLHRTEDPSHELTSSY